MDKMDVQKFEEIPKRKLNLLNPIGYIIFSIFFIVLWIFFLIYYILYYNPPLYHPFLIRIIFWMTLFMFLLINFIIIFFRRKNALNYYNKYYKNEKEELHLTSKTETFCRGCGVVISNQIFKKSDDYLIKPTTISFIKGYFCNKCIKRFHKHWKIYGFLFYITYLILYLPIYFLYRGELGIFELYYVPFLLFFMVIILMHANSRWNQYLKKYA